MNIPRLPPEQGALADFYQEALERLGAICERTWFDRLQVVAEGTAARLWNAEGELLDQELQFPAPGDTGPRDATREVFPGCPLTFRLVEALRPTPLPLERLVLSAGDKSQAPTADVAGRLWYAQFPGSGRWQPSSAFRASHHFSLLALVRCEIQAIDQHWSLHRLALSLPEGAPDEILARDFDFATVVANPAEPIRWPSLKPAQLSVLLQAALQQGIEAELGTMRTRQENHLRRELDRVDDYFAGYERELTERAARSAKDPTKMKAAERLAAARAEHLRRREDQVQRHALRVIPYFDALLLVAEPAWEQDILLTHQKESRTQRAHFVPRCRRWFWCEESGSEA